MKNKILFYNLGGYATAVYAGYVLYIIVTSTSTEPRNFLWISLVTSILGSAAWFVLASLMKPKGLESMTPEEIAQYLARELDSYRRTWYLESSGNGMYKCYVLTRKEWGKPSPNNLLPATRKDIEIELRVNRIENKEEVQRILDLCKR